MSPVPFAEKASEVSTVARWLDQRMCGFPLVE